MKLLLKSVHGGTDGRSRLDELIHERESGKTQVISFQLSHYWLHSATRAEHVTRTFAVLLQMMSSMNVVDDGIHGRDVIDLWHTIQHTAVSIHQNSST